MRRKVLQDYANVFCQMALDYRLAGQRDLEILSQHEKGQLQIDVLTGRCRIDGNDVRPLDFAVSLKEWFNSQLEAKRIAVDSVLESAVEIDFTIELRDEGHPLTMTAYCHFGCKSVIRTDEKVYEGRLAGEKVWGYLRNPAKELGPH